jgi:hypothetical protein
MNKNIFLVCAFLFIGLGFMPLAPVQAAGRQQLHGHIPKAATTAPLIGDMAGSERLKLAISLPLRNKQALESLLKNTYDKKNPHYRHFLTPQKFLDMFGPTESDYQAVIQFAQARGLK